MNSIHVDSLSISTVNGYTLCSENQWFSKIEHEPSSQMSVNLINGIALHTAAQSWFLSLMHKESLSLEVLERVYKISYDAVASSSPHVVYGAKDKETIQDNAVLLLELLMKEDVGEVLAVEYAVKYKIAEGLDFIGQIDIISRNSEGDLILWDLKSSAKKYGNDELRKACEQLLLYRGALNEPAHLQVLTLLKTKTPSIQVHKLKPEELNVTQSELVERFEMVKKSLEHGIHYKSRGWMCSGCGMSHICNSNQKNHELELHFQPRRAA